MINKKILMGAMVAASLTASTLAIKHDCEVKKYVPLIESLNDDGFVSSYVYSNDIQSISLDGSKIRDYAVEASVPYIRIDNTFYTQYGQNVIRAKVQKVKNSSNEPNDDKLNVHYRAVTDTTEYGYVYYIENSGELMSIPDDWALMMIPRDVIETKTYDELADLDISYDFDKGFEVEEKSPLEKTVSHAFRK